MTLEEPKFLLDIRIELSSLFTDEYKVTAKSENLFEVNLLSLRKINNNCLNDKKTRIAQRQTKKKIPVRCPCGYKQYGRSILLAKTATEITSNMKINCLELYIKSNTYSDGAFGTVSMPWIKSFTNYLKNITLHPRLPPVVHTEKLKVINPKRNISLGSLDVIIKFMSLESNFYKFVSSKCNIRIYKSLFSNPKVLDKQNYKINSDLKEAAEKISTSVIHSLNNKSDTTYTIKYNENIVPQLEDQTNIKNFKHKNIFLENLDTDNSVQKIVNELEPSKEGTLTPPRNESKNCWNRFFQSQSYFVNYFTFNKDSANLQPEKEFETDSLIQKSLQRNKDKHEIVALPTLVNFSKKKNREKETSKNTSDTYPNLSVVEVEESSCRNIDCHTMMRHSNALVYDNSLALDVSKSHNECCSSYEKRSSNLNFDEHPCYCTCECKFEFIRETKYCKICGGYEVIGEEFVDTRGQEMPMPCPIFHRLVEKNKLKSRSSSGSLRRRKVGMDGSSRSAKSSKSTKSSTSKASEKRLKVPEKKVIQPKLNKGAKKKKDIKRERNNYSYKTPHAGHLGCVPPCLRSAFLKCNVPKSMGWFWTADNVYGLKYRPTWRPGAAEKQLVHLLQMARHHKQIISKKKKKELVKAKRPLKRPLLVVHKKDGEFTVTMETMKASTQPREVYEPPYEDKPVLTYTIGRTDEENKEREKQKLRKQRRLEREQRTYIQSAFKNMCQEICLKTCQQALGILPEAEDKQGLCYTNTTWVEPEDQNPSCACSENSLSVSDTDSDEWILEFTPPNAFFDPSRKGMKIMKTDKDTEYVPPQS